MKVDGALGQLGYYLVTYLASVILTFLNKEFIL